MKSTKLEHIPGKGIILNQFKFTADSVNILNEIFILDILFLKECKNYEHGICKIKGYFLNFNLHINHIESFKNALKSKL